MVDTLICVHTVYRRPTAVSQTRVPFVQISWETKTFSILSVVLVYTCRSACLSKCARVAVRCPVCMHGAAGTFKFEDNVASVAAVDHGRGCVVSSLHATASQ